MADWRFAQLAATTMASLAWATAHPAASLQLCPASPTSTLFRFLLDLTTQAVLTRMGGCFCGAEGSLASWGLVTSAATGSHRFLKAFVLSTLTERFDGTGRLLAREAAGPNLQAVQAPPLNKRLCTFATRSFLSTIEYLHIAVKIYAARKPFCQQQPLYSLLLLPAELLQTCRTC